MLFLYYIIQCIDKSVISRDQWYCYAFFRRHQKVSAWATTVTSMPFALKVFGNQNSSAGKMQIEGWLSPVSLRGSGKSIKGGYFKEKEQRTGDRLPFIKAVVLHISRWKWRDRGGGLCASPREAARGRPGVTCLQVEAHTLELIHMLYADKYNTI